MSTARLNTLMAMTAAECFDGTKLIGGCFIGREGHMRLSGTEPNRNFLLSFSVRCYLCTLFSSLLSYLHFLENPFNS